MIDTPNDLSPQDVADTVVLGLQKAATSNSWYFDAEIIAIGSWAGLVVTLVGAVLGGFAIWQASGAKSAAQAARDATEKTSRQIQKHISISDASAASIESNEIKHHIQNNNVVAARIVFSGYKVRVIRCVEAALRPDDPGRVDIERNLKRIEFQLDEANRGTQFNVETLNKALNAMHTWLVKQNASQTVGQNQEV